MANVVALLDSMWGWGGFNEPGEEAPRHFRINPNNHSGRRLYRLVGDHRLLVTNACRIVQAHANAHGKPDIAWIQQNLAFLASEKMDLLLVCGRVAQEAFDLVRPMQSRGHNWFFAFPDMRVIPVLLIDHPAARRWSNEKLDSTAKEIERLCLEDSISNK